MCRDGPEAVVTAPRIGGPHLDVAESDLASCPSGVFRNPRVQLHQGGGDPLGVGTPGQRADDVPAITGAQAEHPDGSGVTVQRLREVATHGRQPPGQPGVRVVVGMVPLLVVPELTH